jgi:hypothetical protein
MADAGPDEAERWLRSFPRDLHVDVLLALRKIAILAPSERSLRLTSFSMDSHRHPRGLRVTGDAIDPPARQYLDPFAPDDLHPRTPPIQRDIIACIYSRHHDGHVRQVWAQHLVTSRHRWVVPYALQLAGEYVPEIVEDLVEGFAYLNDISSDAAQAVGAVIAENAGYVQLTAARAASYWDCYYRTRYRRWPDYPSARLLRLFVQSADHVIEQTARPASARFASRSGRKRLPALDR